MNPEVTHQHLSPEWLGVLQAQPGDSDARARLLHLLAVCPNCNRQAEAILEANRMGDLPSHEFDIIDIFLIRSRANAEALLENLLDEPPFLQLGLVESESIFFSWGLCELLCSKSLEQVRIDPEQALHLAQLAVSVSKRVEGWEGVFSSADVVELGQLASAHLGNALRVIGELKAADNMFKHPLPAPLEAGNDILDYRPQVLSLRASLRFAQRRFDESWEDLSATLDLCLHRERPETTMAARCRIQRALVLYETDDLKRACQELGRAAALGLDDQPALQKSILWNRLAFSTQAQDFDLAESLLPEAEAIAADDASRDELCQLDWIKARIQAGRGDVAEAEAALGAVREGFLELNRTYDAALADLERATLLFQQGRVAEVEALAAEMVCVFRGHDIHREALGALTLFQQAAASRELSQRYLGELSTFLHKAQSQRGLQFDPQEN